MAFFDDLVSVHHPLGGLVCVTTLELGEVELVEEEVDQQHHEVYRLGEERCPYLQRVQQGRLCPCLRQLVHDHPGSQCTPGINEASTFDILGPGSLPWLWF